MISIQRERYSDALCQELLPLLRDNWVRTESYISELEIDPAFKKYKKLDEMDMVTCITARRDGALVGYAIFFDNFSLHHQTVHTGHGDMIYVKDEAGLGRTAFRLLDAAEAHLRAKGVRYMGWFVRTGSRFYMILKSRGYVDDEIVMEKKL
jgi:GNAT superfamily N-acetyltransferase